MKTKWFVIVALAMALAVVRFASAAEEHEHKEGEAKIPATISGIWAEVKEHEEQLGKIIADKKLDKVHETAFEIRDLVNALPDKSMDLPTDNLAKVKSNAKYVVDIAKRLDESGDAGDQVATEANFKKLQGLLETIEAQYPDNLAKERHQKSDDNASTGEVDDSTMLSPVWRKIVKTKKELNEVVESGNLKTVHEFAFEIRDLSKELLKRTTDKDLSEEQMNNVKATVEKIAEVAAALDEYGDAGDQANTVKELKRFNSLIDFIEMQYSESGKQEVYYCPMHPTYTSDRPGTCPTCNMNLVKKEITP